MSLEILDAQGGVVRKYTSDDPTEPLVEGRNTPDYWIRPHRALPASAGLHRFVWDMHHERPAVSGFTIRLPRRREHAAHAVRDRGPCRASTRVRLTVDGKSHTQPLIVKMDPRVKTTAADLKLQYDTSRAIDAMLRQTTTALRDIRAAAKTPQVTDLEQRLSRASAPLGQLFGAVESADAAPMPVVLEAVEGDGGGGRAAAGRVGKNEGRAQVARPSTGNSVTSRHYQAG